MLAPWCQWLWLLHETGQENPVVGENERRKVDTGGSTAAARSLMIPIVWPY